MDNRDIKFRIWTGEVLIELAKQDLSLYMKQKNPIMQFTGLKDKNGKEIYEGDIIATKQRDVKFEVVMGWSDDYGTWGWCFKSRGKQWAADKAKGLEVIGNIYENPELLTPNKQ